MIGITSRLKTVCETIIYLQPKTTPLRLQKVLYYMQKYSLKKYGRLLFEEDFHVWVFGATIPELNDCADKIKGEYHKLDDETMDCINVVLIKYEDVGTFDLVKMIQRDLPYEISLEKNGFDSIINKKLLTNY